MKLQPKKTVLRNVIQSQCKPSRFFIFCIIYIFRQLFFFCIVSESKLPSFVKYSLFHLNRKNRTFRDLKLHKLKTPHKQWTGICKETTMKEIYENKIDMEKVHPGNNETSDNKFIFLVVFEATY